MSNNERKLNVEEMIDQFIDQSVIEGGMDKNIEEDVLKQLKKDMRESLENRVNAAILAQIPEHKLAEFEKLLDEKDEKVTQAFCIENIPNLAELIASEFLGFRQRYVA